MAFPDSDSAGLLAEARQGDNAPSLSVSELAGALKRSVESAFSHVRVRGEISGFKRHSSGHCYFTLKDDNACLDAVIWRSGAGALAFRPEDGAEVIATGKLTTYPGRSKYQIVVERMELAGEGALMALLERRRKALAAEGLFDAGRKRPLPFLPKVIGVVTSPTGAVIRDILHRLADRCPTRVILWPVPVQGEGSAAKVAAAIRGFPALEPRPDLLIVARGGGSIEDLWAFNEEEVVRAAAECPIPLISAVGHETDTTLIDFASDLRAPTPTAAAEHAVPVRADLLAHLDELAARKKRCLTRRSELARERLALTACRFPEPAALLASPRQQFDELGDRLPRALGARAGHARADMNLVAGRLRRELVDNKLARLSDRLAATWKMAGLVHPERPLSRGFVRVTDRDGRTLTQAEDARAAGALALRFGDGLVEATVDGSAEAASAPPPRRVERKRGATYVQPQPGLFDGGDE
ncbi:exodeoxyribonuclease VII large subunit [Sphingomonas ginkgonis]|uniref:Exodeoxyribonuclease 7 large subunit n=1 Tax=Sphingomonas ginkgonis TaxID=2315330 RepID=A0A3R9YL00_9SPHN|nr:exodeoxyribonuclease VII large subunit [Sphingomonas ginkgonis]RST29898.1 exodeoxyribonuclease VII large subunit [Sphingomonas ginkgonis]